MLYHGEFGYLTTEEHRYQSLYRRLAVVAPSRDVRYLSVWTPRTGATWYANSRPMAKNRGQIDRTAYSKYGRREAVQKPYGYYGFRVGHRV